MKPPAAIILFTFLFVKLEQQRESLDMTEVLERVTVRSLQEIDILVAEHVMGWRVGYTFAERGATPHYLTDDNTAYKYDQWTPSDSIADAWQVVEKVAPRSHVDDQEWIEFTLNRESHLSYVEIWKVEIYAVPFDHQKILGLTDARTVWRVEARHTSDEITICLAALKTKGIEVTLELSNA